MENNRLSPIQSHELAILRQVVEICEREHITYYLQGGTMLGAIRHKGFIPWDDDIDLGFPREDYERLLRCVSASLPDYMKLRTYNDSSDHHYYFARVVDTRYRIERLGGLEHRQEELWVDLFPLDGMPNNVLMRQIHKLRLSIGRLKFHLSTIEKVNIKRPGRSALEKLVINFAIKTGVGHKGNTVAICDKIDRMLKKYPIEGSDWIVNFMGQTSFKFTEMIPKRIYGKGALYPFEDMTLMGPEDYDGYLKSLYGDYMTPPEDSNKNAHVARLVE